MTRQTIVLMLLLGLGSGGLFCETYSASRSYKIPAVGQSMQGLEPLLRKQTLAEAAPLPDRALVLINESRPPAQTEPPLSLRQKMQRLQALVEGLHQQGVDVQPVGDLMQGFGPLMQEQKFSEAEALVDRALKLAGELTPPGGRQAGPPVSLQQKMNRLQTLVEKRQQEGADMQPILDLMQGFQPLMQQQKFSEAEALVDRALKLLAGTIAQNPAEVVVHLDKSIGTIDPLIYGHFTEETLTSWEGGVSSEMLVDRKFSIPEERELGAPLAGAGGGWEPIELAPTATLVQDQVVYYSTPMSQRITNAGGPLAAGVQQPGYRMALPQIARDQKAPEPFHFRPSEHYRVRIAVKNRDLNGAVFVAIGEDYKHPVAKHAIDLAGGEDWKVYQFELVPTAEANDAKFMIFTESRGTVWVDSASLVRSDLNQGGLRKDVLEATRRFVPANVRWPGGLFVSDH